jgi:small-conductance mechanosensitive channel
MSDTQSAFPPPPPGSIPPPVYSQLPSTVPTYQPPPVAGPPVGYPQGWQQQMWQQQAPPQPGVGAGWGLVGILAQFEPPALWAIIAGLITVIAPIFFGWVFFWLPIVAVITGVRAIMAGKLIGGIVGIVLGAIGGILTLIGLFG